MKNEGYAGRIKNQGTQLVQAPTGGAPAKKGTVKHTGNDLINKKSGK